MLKTVVIVGSGAAGIGAALTLVDKNYRVILLEKGDKFGGASMFGAQGLFAVESKYQTGIDYTVADAYQELIDYTHHRSNSRITKAILEKSAETIDWLDQHGLQTELVNNTQEAHQKKPRTYHQYIDKFNGFNKLIQYFQAKGGRLLTKTAGKKILMENGQIIGIQVIRNGTEETIECQVIIIADGGFIGNKKLVKQHLTINFNNLYSMGERKATGDGIEMLAKIGADISQPPLFENHAASVVSSKNPKWHNETVFSLTNVPFLWVDSSGKRFTNEDICYDFALWGNATYVAGGYYYFLLDQKIIDYLKENSLNWTDSFERTFKTLRHKPMTHKIGPFAKIDSDLAEAINENTAWKADNLIDLSKKMMVPINNLNETVKNYNALVATGKDTDLYKADKFMKFSVGQEPFYAIKACSTSLGTIGGVAVDEKFNVLSPNNRAIPGAFAAGNTAAGGMYDDSYPTIEGLSCAFAWNSGRLAGEAAEDFLSK
ncbi:FAD-dependent oxidoreductase [Oenococcus sp. UCMA 17063]|nr:FAD-dependent oxidoreductase [Oenococcus sp. UCMA 17063]